LTKEKIPFSHLHYVGGLTTSASIPPSHQLNVLTDFLRLCNIGILSQKLYQLLVYRLANCDTASHC
ncbi:hypothetical protein T10_4178, partial [Trichinella papuae]